MCGPGAPNRLGGVAQGGMVEVVGANGDVLVGAGSVEVALASVLVVAPWRAALSGSAFSSRAHPVATRAESVMRPVTLRTTLWIAAFRARPDDPQVGHRCFSRAVAMSSCLSGLSEGYYPTYLTQRSESATTCSRASTHRPASTLRVLRLTSGGASDWPIGPGARRGDGFL